jgi:hypothetical protein
MAYYPPIAYLLDVRRGPQVLRGCRAINKIVVKGVRKED